MTLFGVKSVINTLYSVLKSLRCAQAEEAAALEALRAAQREQRAALEAQLREQGAAEHAALSRAQDAHAALALSVRL